jgi:putative transposase
MGQSLVEIYVHIVFSTKHRQPFLRDAEFRAKTHAYLAGILRNSHCPALVVGGVEDHVHLLCRLVKQTTISDLLRELKRDSSKWAKEQQPQLGDFYWQDGYGAFSISPGHVPELSAYIAHQEEHHRQESFQDKFRRLCAKYQVPIVEQYVWD